MRCAWMRPEASTPPPGANGMIMVMAGDVGQSWAERVPVSATRAAAATIVVLRILVSWFGRKPRLQSAEDQGRWGRSRALDAANSSLG